MLYCKMLVSKKKKKKPPDYSIFKRFQSLSALSMISKAKENILVRTELKMTLQDLFCSESKLRKVKQVLLLRKGYSAVE